ncbi:AAA family ATPase [Brachyspira hyodysenteriae]|uniref:AAA family ATPase n=1 Tax=Brachyspira hyodysenteriae TaxID=159 RepID=UPI0022CDD54D|nr:AAA family ATPase [Brachyspira hyodysenteriae]MCZ9886606.1 AAA family ATPase [Brachyspira hyodysenteriae]
MIKDFAIHNYRQFKNAKFDNFANINLFVGENDTGKTTILKFLYCISNELKNSVGKR